MGVSGHVSGCSMEMPQATAVTSPGDEQDVIHYVMSMEENVFDNDRSTPAFSLDPAQQRFRDKVERAIPQLITFEQATCVKIRGDRLCALNTLCMKRRGKDYYDSIRRDNHGIAINDTQA